MNEARLAKLVDDLQKAVDGRRLLVVVRDGQTGEVVNAQNVGISTRLSNPGHFVIIECVVSAEAIAKFQGGATGGDSNTAGQ